MIPPPEPATTRERPGDALHVSRCDRDPVLDVLHALETASGTAGQRREIGKIEYA